MKAKLPIVLAIENGLVSILINPDDRVIVIHDYDVEGEDNTCTDEENKNYIEYRL